MGGASKTKAKVEFNTSEEMSIHERGMVIFLSKANIYRLKSAFIENILTNISSRKGFPTFENLKAIAEGITAIAGGFPRTAEICLSKDVKSDLEAYRKLCSDTPEKGFVIMLNDKDCAFLPNDKLFMESMEEAKGHVRKERKKEVEAIEQNFEACRSMKRSGHHNLLNVKSITNTIQ